MAITTIQLSPKTRKALASLKLHPRQSYDELLNKLMTLVPTGDDEGKYTAATRARLLQARIDSIQGHVISDAQLERLMR